MTRLRFEESYAAAEQILESEARLQALSEEIERLARAEVGGMDPARALSRALRTQQPIHLPGPVGQALDLALAQWNSGCREYRQRLTQAESLFADELKRKLVELRGIASDARFQEAVFLSNPDFVEFLEDWIGRPADGPPNLRERLRIRTIMMYLQRFCTKNDTTSFFGPFAWGRLGQTDSNLALNWGSEQVSQRRVFFAHWAIVALAAKIASVPEVRALLPLRRNPAFVIQGNGCCRINIEQGPPTVDEALSLSDLEQEILARCNRGLTAEAVLADMSLAAPPAPAPARQALQAALSRLESLGVVVRDLLIPTQALEPLEFLRQQLARLPEQISGSWLALLNDLDARRAQFEVSALDERKRLLTEIEGILNSFLDFPVRRGKGEFYADRLVVYEDCVRDVTIAIGHDLAHTLTHQLPKSLELMLWLPTLEHNLWQQKLAAWFRTRFVGLERVGLVEFVRGLQEDRAVMQVLAQEVSHATAESAKLLSGWVPRQDNDGRTRLALEEALISRALQESPFFGVANPDVMIAAESVEAIHRGEFKVILAEVHAIRELLSHSPLIFGLPPAEQNQLANEIAENLRAIDQGRTTFADTLLRHVRKTDAALQLPIPDVEWLGCSTKSSDRIIAVQDLDVVIDAGSVFLYDRKRQVRLRLSDIPLVDWFEQDHTPLRVFTLPRCIDLIDAFGWPVPGTFTPRLEIDGVILRRATWSVRTPFLEEAPKGYAFKNFLNVLRWKRQLGLPALGFAKFLNEDVEQKPLFIDFANYFLVDILARWSKRPAGEILTFSEMLPGPDELWLQKDGQHFTCEMRLAYFRPRQVAEPVEAPGASPPVES
jgi:hypothetical protein